MSPAPNWRISGQLRRDVRLRGWSSPTDRKGSAVTVSGQIEQHREPTYSKQNRWYSAGVVEWAGKHDRGRLMAVLER